MCKENLKRSLLSILHNTRDEDEQRTEERMKAVEERVKQLEGKLAKE